MDTLFDELRERISGEVRFDKASKILYSTDASIYQIEPIGVVIPKRREDVVETIKIANRHKVPVLPRGGGTSLGGQTVGEAIIIDMSKYLNKIIEINQEEQWVRAEPGIVLDELNAQLRPYGLLFAPDVSTSTHANIGGMIGNNSAGSRSLVYGKTVDHIKELRVVLSNGEETTFREIDLEEAFSKGQGNDFESRIYREIRRIASANKEEILKRYPKINRRVSGYNLDEFVKEGGTFNMARMVVGSEGTLATVVEAKINLVPRPKMSALDIIHFESVFDAMDASAEILECNPVAIEMMDKMILDLTKSSPEYSRKRTFLQGDPGAILVAEFYGTSREELVSKIENLEARLKRNKHGFAYVRVFEEREKANVWGIRKAGVGLLLGVKGEKKPIAFVEDTAVSPEKLPEYVRRFHKILTDHDTNAGYYGHASVGCLHIRPCINLKDESEIKKMRSISEQISDLVLEFGGSMSGEHGDGLARSEWNKKMFGPVIYKAFQEVKAAFDPNNLMNPGKVVNAPPMTENLRYGTSYKAIPIVTHFNFLREGGFDKAVELCNGNGVCKKRLDGTMCPSYMVTHEEEHSTRGRANLLRAILSGRLPREEFTGKRLYDALDLCLECKGCKGECPSNVDMAKLKYEFLSHYIGEHGLPLRSWMFGNIALLNKIGCFLAPFSNTVMQNKVNRWLLDRLVGIDQRRTLPPFAPQTFTQWFKTRNGSRGTGEKGTVVLFNDSFMTYNYPHIGIAATQLLEKIGFHVILPKKKCCGRPMISKGMIEEAREHAQYNVAQLAGYVEKGYKIVGCEPSCILTFRDEYPDLVDGEQVKLVAENSYMIEEFLSMLHEQGQLNNVRFKDVKKKILLHGHCHQKALIGTGPSLSTLRIPPGFEVEEIDSGCCGMAGSFGYEAEHYDISMAVGDRRLFKAINSKGNDVEVVAAGISCRQQIEQGTGRRAKHLVEVMLEAIE